MLLCADSKHNAITEAHDNGVIKSKPDVEDKGKDARKVVCWANLKTVFVTNIFKENCIV